MKRRSSRRRLPISGPHLVATMLAAVLALVTLAPNAASMAPLSGPASGLSFGALGTLNIFDIAQVDSDYYIATADGVYRTGPSISPPNAWTAFRSTSTNGATALAQPTGRVIGIAYERSRNVLLAVTESNGLYQSTPDKVAWKKIDTGAALSGERVTSASLHATGYLYIGLGSGKVVEVDTSSGASTVLPVAVVAPNAVSSISSLVRVGDRLFAGTSNGNIYFVNRTDPNQPAAWEAAWTADPGTGSATFGSVGQLVSTNGLVFAATNKLGVLQRDAGANQYDTGRIPNVTSAWTPLPVPPGIPVAPAVTTAQSVFSFIDSHGNLELMAAFQPSQTTRAQVFFATTDPQGANTANLTWARIGGTSTVPPVNVLWPTGDQDVLAGTIAGPYLSASGTLAMANDLASAASTSTPTKAPSTTATPTKGPSSTATSSPQPTPKPGTDVEVTITNEGFFPPTVVVYRGGTVRWVNRTSSNTHQVKNSRGVVDSTQFDSNSLDPGGSFSQRFDAPTLDGDLQYYDPTNNLVGYVRVLSVTPTPGPTDTPVKTATLTPTETPTRTETPAKSATPVPTSSPTRTPNAATATAAASAAAAAASAAALPPPAPGAAAPLTRTRVQPVGGLALSVDGNSSLVIPGGLLPAAVDVALVPLVRPEPRTVARLDTPLSYAQLTISMVDTGALGSTPFLDAPDTQQVRVVASTPYDFRMSDAASQRDLPLVPPGLDFGIAYHLDDFPRGATESGVTLARWDEVASRWVPLTTTLDADRRIAHAQPDAPGIIALLAPMPASTVQDDGTHVFPSSDFTVAGAIFDRLGQVGGLARTGLPISNEQLAGTVRTQYFQNARFDLDTVSGGFALGDLGSAYFAVTGRGYAPVADQGSDQDHRYFPDTGQYVQFGLLSFYDASDGPDLLGSPISPELFEGGRTVQYFAKGRLEWVPSAGGARFSNLGEDYLRAVAQLQPS